MEIDNLDKNIIKELFLNSRASNKEIGKRLRASKEVINYRITKLKEKGIIKKFIPIINFFRTGHYIYRIQFKFRNKYKETWEDFFKQIPQTSWIVELQGYWDLVVLFWIKDNEEFFAILEKIYDRFGEELQEILFTMVASIYNLPPNFALDEASRLNNFYYKIGSDIREKNKLSETEIAIISELLQDGRASVLSISKKINVSATAVNYNIKKLKKEGIILAFVPVIDHKKLNLTHLKITLNLLNPAQKNKLRGFLLTSGNVIYVTESYGKYDLEFEYISEKVEQLFSFINEIQQITPLKNHEIIYDNKEILINEIPRKVKNATA